MNWSANCAVVVPCCDEAALIGPLVQAVRRHLPSVIVVDDGSADETSARAAAAGASVVRHDRNLGKGAAIKAGAAAALDRRFSWMLLMDGDGQHRPEDIPAFLRRAEDTGAPLIIGNRMLQAEAIPWLRRQTNRWMSRRISSRAGRPLPDSQCGFRLVKLDAWAALRFDTNHFEIESEMVLAFVRARHRVEFVPVQVVGKGPHSHIRVVKDSWRWLCWWRSEARRPLQTRSAPVLGRSNVPLPPRPGKCNRA